MRGGGVGCSRVSLHLGVVGVESVAPIANEHEVNRSRDVARANDESTDVIGGKETTI